MQFSRRDFLRNATAVAARFSMPISAPLRLSAGLATAITDDALFDRVASASEEFSNWMADISEGHENIEFAVYNFLRAEDGFPYECIEEALQNSFSMLTPAVAGLSKASQLLHHPAVQAGLKEIQNERRAIATENLRELATWAADRLPDVVCEEGYIHEDIAAAANQCLNLVRIPDLETDVLERARDNLQFSIQNTPNLPYGYSAFASAANANGISIDEEYCNNDIRNIIRIADKHGLSPEILSRADDYINDGWVGIDTEHFIEYDDIFEVHQKYLSVFRPLSDFQNPEDIFDKMIGAVFRQYTNPEAEIFRSADPDRVSHVIDTVRRFGLNVLRAQNAEKSKLAQSLMEQEAVFDPRSEDTEATGRPVYRNSWMPRGNDYY